MSTSDKSMSRMLIAAATILIGTAVVYHSNRQKKIARKNKNLPKLKVLVIGGGIGGLTAIVGLRKYDQNVEICLVEPKDYFEILWASVRATFDAKAARDATVPLDKFVQENNVQHIRAVVTKLSTKQATLDNGETVEFDVAVVATGATQKWPGTGRVAGMLSASREERLHALEHEGDKLTFADKVLIVGGGLIGSELAGDVADFAKEAGHTDQHVTLVQSGKQLCPELDPAGANMVKEKLERLGVKVILNDRVVESNGKMVLQNKGDVIEADEVVWASGIYANNSFMDPKFLNEKGWIVTDDCFVVKNSDEKLFAVGDCSTVMNDNGREVLENVKVLGKNIKTVLDAKRQGSTVAEGELTKYSQGLELYALTIGKRDGACGTPWGPTQYFIPWVKQKTLFLFRAKLELGLK